MTTEKYKNKYRIQSNRLQGWNYGCNSAYFITICTHRREPFLGRVENGKMQLSGIGLLANRIWVEISNHFPFVESDNFVIMPNHVHGIIAINKTGDGNYDCDDQYCRNAINRVSTIPTIPTIPMETIGSKIQRGGITGNKNPMLYKNLATIIRWYKGRVSFESHKIQPYFKWQSNYHDHIIRNEVEYIRIKKYIINNPLNWKEDKFFHL